MSDVLTKNTVIIMLWRYIFMKRLLILSLLYLAMPAYALCSVDAENSVCALPNFNTNKTHLFQNTNKEANLNSIQTPLQPFRHDNLFNEPNIPNNELMKYDSGCQFGLCVQDLKQNIPYNK